MIPETRFGCVLADPNWIYQNWTASKNGAAVSAYPCSKTSDIASVPVASFCASDAILALWCTLSKLPDGLDVMKAWNFTFVTSIPWVKTVPSTGNIRSIMGFWTRATTEILMIGRRGKAKRKKGSPSLAGLTYGDERVFWAPSGSKHSQKPYGIHEWLSATCEGPYLELFARTEKPDWTCWGHDTGWHLSKDGVEPVEKQKP